MIILSNIITVILYSAYIIKTVVQVNLNFLARPACKLYTGSTGRNFVENTVAQMNVNEHKKVAYVLANQKFFLQDKIPHFAGPFSFLQDTPGLFKTYLKYYWPYTSNALNSSILYQKSICRTLSRICRTAGYLRQKSRTVGNYEVGVIHFCPHFFPRHKHQ